MEVRDSDGTLTQLAHCPRLLTAARVRVGWISPVMMRMQIAQLPVKAPLSAHPCSASLYSLAGAALRCQLLQANRREEIAIS